MHLTWTKQSEQMKNDRKPISGRHMKSAVAVPAKSDCAANCATEIFQFNKFDMEKEGKWKR